MRGNAARIGLVVAGALLLAHPAWAQAHNPFSVGISEGGGSAGGLTGWLLGMQAMFERQLSAAVRATRSDGSALAWLTGLSFLYGVFHAAGPGHGKAVMASYLFANERALRRGLVLTGLAALLQGVVAIALVGCLALILHATAQRMKDAASLVESLSYAGIAVLGAWLVWRKGRGFWAAVRAMPAESFALPFPTPPVALAAPGGRIGMVAEPETARAAYALGFACGCDETGTFRADAGDAAACGHYHGPDPRMLDAGFSWREAVLTVFAAGSRPCSGAILVLVFAMTQGLFMTGVAAVLAMSLGTAITTGALATLAVLAKGVTLRLARPGTRRGILIVRGLELTAAAVVLAAGLSLFFGYVSLGGA